jgi:hypothetical protein
MRILRYRLRRRPGRLALETRGSADRPRGRGALVGRMLRPRHVAFDARRVARSGMPVFIAQRSAGCMTRSRRSISVVAVVHLHRED